MIVAKNWQRAEGAVVFVAAIAVFTMLESGLPWWAAVLVFFAPDLSFFAYLGGTRLGAAAYNITHVYGFGAFIAALAFLLGSTNWAGLGLLFIAHSGFDRMLGYGLKSEEGFQITHLGPIGKAK